MINEIIKKRFSTRAYSDKSVEKEKLLKLFEAARWAPSSRNEQPWRFIVVTKYDEEYYEKLFNTLSESNKVWVKKAPVLVLVLAKKTISGSVKTNRYSFYDTGSAVAMLVLQAYELGLYVHQLGGFNPIEAAKVLKVSDDLEPAVVLVIGYRGSVKDLPEYLRIREETARTRKPLDNIVFSGEFGRVFINDKKKQLISEKHEKVNS